MVGLLLIPPIKRKNVSRETDRETWRPLRQTGRQENDKVDMRVRQDRNTDKRDRETKRQRDRQTGTAAVFLTSSGQSVL